MAQAQDKEYIVDMAQVRRKEGIVDRVQVQDTARAPDILGTQLLAQLQEGA